MQNIELLREFIFSLSINSIPLDLIQRMYLKNIIAMWRIFDIIAIMCYEFWSVAWFRKEQ